MVTNPIDCSVYIFQFEYDFSKDLFSIFGKLKVKNLCFENPSVFYSLFQLDFHFFLLQYCI